MNCTKEDIKIEFLEKELDKFRESNYQLRQACDSLRFDLRETIKNRHEQTQRWLQSQERVAELHLENEFLKHMNSKYREEIWNHEFKKV